LIGDPSLPLVTLNRWIENLEAFAISSKISDVEASALTVMVSGSFLIGRPVEGLAYVQLARNKQRNSCLVAIGTRLTARTYDECESRRRHCSVLLEPCVVRGTFDEMQSGSLLTCFRRWSVRLFGADQR
jgi:hypothetical protein